jgi:thymidylate kinase
MRPYLIAFVGPVGVGKSAQMKLLAYRIRSKGLKVKTVFLLKGHYFSYFFEIFLAKILLLDRKPSVFKRIFKLWLIIDTFSLCLKFLLEIYIPIKLGYIVLVEEYLPSTITHYLYYCHYLKLPVRIINFSSRISLSWRC